MTELPGGDVRTHPSKPDIKFRAEGSHDLIVWVKLAGTIIGLGTTQVWIMDVRLNIYMHDNVIIIPVLYIMFPFSAYFR